MRKKRVLVLMHADLVPPDDIAGKPDAAISEYKTEYDVLTGLRDLGHEAQPLGLYDDLAVFNRPLTEEEVVALGKLEAGVRSLHAKK